MRAWVVSVLSLEAAKKAGCPVRVLAVFSARQDEDNLGFYLEGLYRTFRADIREHLEVSKYNNAAESKANVCKEGSEVYFASGPYVFRAQRAEILDVRLEDGAPWVRWQPLPYRRIRQDPQTHQVIDEGEQTYEVQEAPQAEFQLNDLF